MANTYTKIYLHIVFAVKGREALIRDSIESRIYNYISATLRNLGHHVIAINGTENHLHILIDYNVAISIPDTIQRVKTSSTKMINEQRLTNYKFAWQRGYSCFSYAESQIESVRRYIDNQKEHHKNKSLREEMIFAYRAYNIEFSEDFIFEE